MQICRAYQAPREIACASQTLFLFCPAVDHYGKPEEPERSSPIAHTHPQGHLKQDAVKYMCI